MSTLHFEHLNDAEFPHSTKATAVLFDHVASFCCGNKLSVGFAKPWRPRHITKLAGNSASAAGPAPRGLPSDTNIRFNYLQFSEKIGLPTEEGIFGFKPFAEVWVGRLAMGGFISSIVVRLLDGFCSCTAVRLFCSRLCHVLHS